MADANALITWGGWDGHEPDKVARIVADLLAAEELTSDVVDTLGCLDDPVTWHLNGIILNLCGGAEACEP